MFSVTYGVSRGFSDSLANYSYVSDLLFGPSAEIRLAIINGSSAFGRITPLLAAQWVGFINVHATFAVTSAIMLFCWTRARDVTGVLVFDALYGVSSGESGSDTRGRAASPSSCVASACCEHDRSDPRCLRRRVQWRCSIFRPVPEPSRVSRRLLGT